MLICRSQPLKKPFKMPVVNYEKDIVNYKVVDYVKKIGEGEEDFIVKKRLIETERFNRQEFINKQAIDHNIYGIIDKVINTGDVSLLHCGKEGVYGDFSNLLVDRGELVNNLQDAKDAVLKNIPQELIGDMSLEDFVKSVTEEAVKKYYASKNENKEEVKE